MYSSPGTPTGHSRMSSSRTCARQPRRGYPIGSDRSHVPDSSVPTTQTVVSVGPYQLWKRVCADQRATCSGPGGSPAVTRSRRRGSRAGSTSGSRAGGMNPQVTSCASRNRCRRAGSVLSSSGTSCTQPPTVSGASMSSTETSNPSAENAIDRHVPSRPKWAAAAEANATAEAWLTTTPLGRPVDPDVYRT